MLGSSGLRMESSTLFHKAVCWPFTGKFDSRGEPKVGDPVQINSRWEIDGREARATDQSPKNVLFEVDVDRELTIGSRLWRGELKNLPTGLDPLQQFRVVEYKEVPDVKCRSVQRTVVVT